VLEPRSPIMAMARERGLPVEPFVMRQWRLPLSILAFRRVAGAGAPGDRPRQQLARQLDRGARRQACCNPRPKVIRTRHISAPLNKNATTHLLYRRLFDMVIVTGGERNRQDLIHRDGLAPERVASFPIGLDVEHFSPAKPHHDIRAELGIPSGHLLVGMISYLRDYKGHRYLVEAAAKVLKEHQGVAFLIVGEGPEEQNIRAQIERLGLTADVRMLGFRDDLLDVFRSLNAVCDSHGRRRYHSPGADAGPGDRTSGGLDDHGIDSRCPNRRGVRVHRPAAGCRCLGRSDRRLLIDPELRAAMGRRGRQTVEQSYSIDRMVDELERVYRRVIAS
jgi:glycosyltransferase involved in cell wall biosynthesis